MCLSQAGNASEWLNGSSLLLAQRLHYNKIQVYPKVTILLSGNFSQTPHLENFAMARPPLLSVINKTQLSVNSSQHLASVDVSKCCQQSTDDCHSSVALRIEQGLTSHQTHYRLYRGRVFMGLMTQPTVSKH